MFSGIPAVYPCMHVAGHPACEPSSLPTLRASALQWPNLSVLKKLRALEDVLPALCWNDTIQVFSLEVVCECQGDILWVKPVRATPVLARGSGRAAADGEGDGEEDGRSSGSDASGCKAAHASASKLSDLPSSDKEHFELCSSGDRDVEVDSKGGSRGCGPRCV